MTCETSYLEFKRTCLGSLWPKSGWKGKCFKNDNQCPFYDMKTKIIGNTSINLLPKGEVEFIHDKSTTVFPIFDNTQVEELFTFLAVEMLKKEEIDKDLQIVALSSILTK